MAGRSEDIEALLSDVEKLVACVYAQAASDKLEAVEGKSADDRMKAAADVAKAGRAVKLFRGNGRRVGRAIAGLRRPADAVADEQEIAMNDDDSRWTPERIADLHARVRERLAKFAGSRELKYLAERDLARSRGAVLPDAADPGGPPGPAG